MESLVSRRNAHSPTKNGKHAKVEIIASKFSKFCWYNHPTLICIHRNCKKEKGTNDPYVFRHSRRSEQPGFGETGMEIILPLLRMNRKARLTHPQIQKRMRKMRVESQIKTKRFTCLFTKKE